MAIAFKNYQFSYFERQLHFKKQAAYIRHTLKDDGLALSQKEKKEKKKALLVAEQL
jgi:hypothetical protein